MPGKKKTAEDLKKEDDVRRQHSVRKKREDSGLKGVMIYLDLPTKEILGELCLKNGYNDPRSVTNATSNTIGALIRKASRVEHEFECSSVKAHQELYKLRTIALYRKDKHKENYAKIAKFMETCGYPRPCVAAGAVGPIKRTPWRKADIETLLNISELEELIKQGDEMSVRKNTVAMKKKKRLEMKKARKKK